METKGRRAGIESKRRAPAVIGAILVTLLGGSGLVMANWDKIAAPPATATAAPVKLAAIVDGHHITDSELTPVLAQGVDRAVAVDRYINKVVAAELARKAYSGEAADAIRATEREVLSQLYIAKRTEALLAAINDADIKDFYDKNVSADSYAGYRVRFLVTQDPKDADGVVQAIAAGKAAEVAPRFKYAQEGGDGFLLASELPFGLGNVVSSLKKGEYSRPLVLRNGIFILHLEDTKANPKPELEKLAGEIKSLLVAQRLAEELASARAAAKVELK